MFTPILISCVPTYYLDVPIFFFFRRALEEQERERLRAEKRAAKERRREEARAKEMQAKGLMRGGVGANGDGGGAAGDLRHEMERPRDKGASVGNGVAGGSGEEGMT